MEAGPRRSVLDTHEDDDLNASAAEVGLRRSVLDTHEDDGLNASAAEVGLRHSVLDTREDDDLNASAAEVGLRRSVLDTREDDGPSASGAGVRPRAGKERWGHTRSEERFISLDDLVGRTGLRRDEIVTLSDIGALNAFGYDRRSALWQAERAVRPSGELFEEREEEGRGQRAERGGRRAEGGGQRAGGSGRGMRETGGDVLSWICSRTMARARSSRKIRCDVLCWIRTRATARGRYRAGVGPRENQKSTTPVRFAP